MIPDIDIQTDKYSLEVELLYTSYGEFWELIIEVDASPYFSWAYESIEGAMTMLIRIIEVLNDTDQIEETWEEQWRKLPDE